MKVPVVMAPAPEPPIRARSDPWRPVVGHRIKIINARVLAPFPDVSAHIVDAELVWPPRAISGFSTPTLPRIILQHAIGVNIGWVGDQAAFWGIVRAFSDIEFVVEDVFGQGKITEDRDYADDLGLLHQLGVLPTE